MACDTVAPLYLEYENRLKGFVQKRVKDKDVSNDIMHQVLLKIHSHCEQIPDVRNIKAWLYQVTRNAVYDYFREEGKKVLLEEDYDLEENMEQDLQKEIADYIRPMIQMLPAMYAEPLALSGLEGVPQKEVADKLGISLSGAKSRIQRGREKLRDLFTECWMLELDQNGKLISMELRPDCYSLQQVKKSPQQVLQIQDDNCSCAK
jgi:RNA polymerase sigma-70 factor (ECF subfamily)